MKETKQWSFGKVTLRETKSGFGWQFSDNSGTDTIVNVLDRIESLFKLEKSRADSLEEEIKDLAMGFDNPDYDN